jgi:serine/threonine protein kinase
VSTDAVAGVLPEPTLVGSVVAGKYRVDRLIGQGGMGAVFQATNVVIGKRVALKFLTREAARDQGAAERFQREALAASMVESSHIVQIFDSGTTEDGLPFLVMELLSGEDLRARLRREGRLTVEAAAAVAAQVLRALARAHAQGIVHRDLKPDNIYLCQRDDSALFVKLVDFGVSKLGRGTTLDTLTGRGTVLGTAHYMSPEQAQAYADIDGRTDLFGVGAMLYECLSGHPPHVGPTYEAVLIAICTKDPEDIRSLAPDVPRAVADVIHRALARDRTQRYASAEAMLEALSAAIPDALLPRADSRRTPLPALEGSLVESATFTSTSRSDAGNRRRRVRSVALGAVAIFAGFAVTALWLGARGPAAQSPESLAAAPTVFAEATARHAPAAPSALAADPPPAPSATSNPAATPSTSARTRTTKATARSAPGREQKPQNGVISGLELSTREP